MSPILQPRSVNGSLTQLVGLGIIWLQIVSISQVPQYLAPYRLPSPDGRVRVNYQFLLSDCFAAQPSGGFSTDGRALVSTVEKRSELLTLESPKHHSVTVGSKTVGLSRAL